MSILSIITDPNELLRRKSAEISPQEAKNGRWSDFADDMAETMLVKDGVGLAAPQVGHNIRLITVNTKGGVLAMINPVLTKKSLAKNWDEEGCLSVPNTFGQVRRHTKVRCRFITPQGETKHIEANGFLARVIQHEIDHLDGILFIDKARDIHEANTL